MTDTLDKAQAGHSTVAHRFSLRDVQERGLKLRGIGVPWFTAQSWPRLLAIAADRADLPDTFEDSSAVLASASIVTSRPAIRSRRCLSTSTRSPPGVRELGVPVDARARSVFAAVTLAQQASQAQIRYRLCRGWSAKCGTVSGASTPRRRVTADSSACPPP